MPIIETAHLNLQLKEGIYRLWNQEYPAKVNYKTLADLDTYLNNLTDTNHYLLQDNFKTVEGWAFSFTRENERWFAIILDSKAHGQGKGTLLLNKLKEKEQRLSGWVVDHNNDVKQDGKPYKSPLKFYEKNSFTICSETRLETEKLSAVKIVWEQNQTYQPPT